MKAPDVIYLAESDKVKGEVSSNFASDNPFKTHTSIAYIRKEALLEWLNSEIKKEMEDHYDDFSFGIAYGNVLEHINEM